MMDRCKCGALAAFALDGIPMCIDHFGEITSQAFDKARQDRWLKNQQDKSAFTLDNILQFVHKQPFEFGKNLNDFETINAYQTADFLKEQQK